MASPEYVVAQLAGLDAGAKKSLSDIFRYVLGNLRFGRPTAQTRAENIQAYYVDGRTHATPGTEFSIVHGIGSAPYMAIPVINLQAVGASLVPLTVSRAADGARLYFTSSEADAPFTLLVEAP